MEIVIHPEGERAMNRQADQLLEMCGHLLAEKATPAENFLLVNGWSVPVDLMWQRKRVAGSVTSEPVAIAFAVKGQVIRIEEQQFVDFMRFAEKVQSRPEFRELVSVASTAERLIRWVQGRLEGFVQTSFIEHFQEWMRDNVAEHVIVFPIYELILDGQMGVDGVEIRTLTHSELNAWFIERTDSEADEWRTKIGGRAAAFVTLRAEPIRAKEIAYEKVDRVLAVLRSYSPAMLIAQSRSFCTIFGTEHVEILTAFTIGPQGLISVSQEELGGAEGWHLNEATLKDFAGMSFLETCDLLEVASPTQFQLGLIRALILYSRAGLEHRVESKLLYVLAALESLLLMSDTEPPTSNLARRFGFFVGVDLERRRAIRDRTKKVYELRSQFVHHGQGIDALQLVDKFLEDAWWFFRLIVRVADRYPDKIAFLSAMEDEMLTGPTQVTDDLSQPGPDAGIEA